MGILNEMLYASYKHNRVRSPEIPPEKWQCIFLEQPEYEKRFQEEKHTVIKITCAWCSKDMGEKEGFGEIGVSHSICPECNAKVEKDLEIAANMRSYWANLNSHSER